MSKGPSADPLKRLTVSTNILLPTRPRFLRFGRGTEGEGSISISALTDTELRALGRAWTAALIEDAAKIRAAKKDPFGVNRAEGEEAK